MTVLGSGLEAYVFAGDSPRWGPVAVKVPTTANASNVNDPNVDFRAQFDDELALTRHLRQHGFLGCAVVHTVADIGGLPALVMSRLAPPPADAHPSPARIGELVAALHAVPPPPFVFASQGDVAAEDVIAERLPRRLTALETLSPGLTNDLDLTAPELSQILGESATDRRSVLHLDIRSSNLLTEQARPSRWALVDWSNALVGPPLLEMARIREISDVWSPDLEAAYRAGGANTPSCGAAEMIYRLDASVMLALVFAFEAPNPTAMAAQLPRVKSVIADLLAVLPRSRSRSPRTPGTKRTISAPGSTRSDT